VLYVTNDAISSLVAEFVILLKCNTLRWNDSKTTFPTRRYL